MIERKRLSGILNKDDRIEDVLSQQHIDAVNLRFYGGANGLTAENIVGNTLIPNSYKPSGDNECIGGCYDSVKNRIIWGNWNSNSRHGIYMCNLATMIITPLLVCFTDSTTDILGFDRDYPMADPKIIYNTEEEGDIFLFNTRNKRPKKLNILDAENDLYGSDWLEEYLDVAKEPPLISPICAYEDDATSTVNNLKNKLFKFKYRFWYKDNEKSTWGSISEMPIPVDYVTPATDTDQTKNCRIGIIYQTGGNDVVKVEIAGCQNINDTFSNYFSIVVLDKQELAIPDNDLSIFNFYNDTSYIYVDLDESLLSYDRVPDLANAQELLNGNVIVYGGITEGQDPVEVDMTVTIQEDRPAEVGCNTVSIWAIRLDNDDLKLTAVGIPAYDSFSPGITSTRINYLVSVGVTIFSWQAVTPNTTTTIQDLLTQLSTQAIADGFTIITLDAHNLVIRRANQDIYGFFSSRNGNLRKPVGESVFALDYSSKQRYGVIYFDDKGKDNGVFTSDDGRAVTFPYQYSTDIDQVINFASITFNHTPPIWAESYIVARTRNLTKSSYVYWVSDRTLKDDKYGYISIETLYLYKRQNPTSVIGFDFLTGDRIKFCSLLRPIPPIDFDDTRDYEIFDLVTNPKINGLTREGKFVKIVLPTFSGGFNFGDNLSDDYYYYSIVLYTPAKSAPSDLDPFFECGTRQPVLFAHTPERHHSNIPQTLFGDTFYRIREIRAGSFFYADLVADNEQSWSQTILRLDVPENPVGTSYTVRSTQANNLVNWPSNYLIKTGLVPVTFNIKGELVFKCTVATSSNLLLQLFIWDPSLPAGSQVPVIQDVWIKLGGAAKDEIIKANIDYNFSMLANRVMMLVCLNSPYDIIFITKAINGRLTIIDTDHDFNLGIVDENFSDFQVSKVDVNGRGNAIDPDAKRRYYSTLMRWGLSLEPNTNINQINRFFPLNFDEIDRSKGDIQRFKSRDRILRVFQNRAVGQYGVLARFIQNNQGDSQLVTTNDILTKGNINYYAGEHGLGTQYTSLVSSDSSDYFPDIVTGDMMRLATDGFTPIGDIYKGQFYIRDLLIPYNKPYIRSNGATAKILGCFDPFEGQYIALLQGGSYGGNTISSYAFSFNDRRKGFCSFYKFNLAEWIMSAEDTVYSWLNGDLWVHNNTQNRCQFYGINYEASITLVFNANLFDIKTFEGIAELSSHIWRCPIIYTSVKSYAGQRQESELIDVDFADLEGEFKAAFLRDIHSQHGLLNGDFLKGAYIVLKFEISNAQNLVTLSEVSVLSKDSPLNLKQ